MQLEISQPNVALRFSGMRSNSRGSLILWANCFAVATSNLSWAKYESYHTCRSVTCCIFTLQNLTLPTIQHYLVLKFLSWCSHRLGLRVCIQCLGIVLCHLSQLETHGSTTKNFSQQNLRNKVLMSFAVYWDLKSLSMCLRPSSSDQTSKIFSVHCHPHVFLWIVEQCCTMFALFGIHPTQNKNQIHMVKLPNVRCVWSSIHATDQFCQPYPHHISDNHPLVVSSR